jgi:hemoglobin
MSNEGSTLYERLGGREGIGKIAKDIMGLHAANSVLIRRYGHAKKSPEELERLLAEFLCSLAGGDDPYTGMSMTETHTGMNVHSDEFVEAIDDFLKAFEKNGVSREDRDALLGLCYGLKSEVVGL